MKRPALLEDTPLPGKKRLRLLSLGFGLCLAIIAGRLAELSLVSGWFTDPTAPAFVDYRMPRPDIVDRNGVLLATDLSLASLFADPRKIIDVDEAIELLTATVPELEARELRRLLTQDRAFVWLKRQISPGLQAEIHNLGIPGIGFRSETRRVYPNRRLAAHAVGFVSPAASAVRNANARSPARAVLPHRHRSGRRPHPQSACAKPRPGAAPSPGRRGRRRWSTRARLRSHRRPAPWRPGRQVPRAHRLRAWG
jgi:hypothetical protein